MAKKDDPRFIPAANQMNELTVILNPKAGGTTSLGTGVRAPLAAPSVVMSDTFHLTAAPCAANTWEMPMSSQSDPGGSTRSHHHAAGLARLESVTWLLDSALRVPGTSVRFGVDAVSNVIPGIGPLVSKGVSAWLVIEAFRLGVPRAVVLQMLGNIGLDAVIGAVPVVGWVADVFFRANRRNLALLRTHLATGAVPAAARGSPVPLAA
jgi:hypothetical protein